MIRALAAAGSAVVAAAREGGRERAGDRSPRQAAPRSSAVTSLLCPVPVPVPKQKTRNRRL